MKPAFADTSYYLALLSEHDVHHNDAIAWSQILLGQIVVTEYVLVELGNAAARSKYRDRYVPFVHQVLADPATLFIPASLSLFHKGLALFSVRSDKHWSLVDCISFVVMKQHRLKEALTADRHFVQAGYRALLRERAGK